MYTIYVISSSSIENGIRLIKIGITAEFGRRMGQYYSSNPLTKFLYRIDGIEDPRVESYLHNLFRDHLYRPESKGSLLCDSRSALREWFIWSDDIINFFEEHKDSPDYFNSLFPDSEYDDLNKLPSRYNMINLFMYSLLDELGFRIPLSDLLDFYSELQEKFDSYLVSSTVVSWYSPRKLVDLILSSPIISKYSPSSDNIFNSFRSSLLVYSSVESDLLKELSSISSDYLPSDKLFMTSRLKIVVDQIKLTGDMSILTKLRPVLCWPSWYSLSVLNLGPDKISALKYQESDILRELNNLGKDDEIGKRILEEFKVGEKYSNAYIKGRLIDLYRECGILEKKPTASILDKYFNVSEAKVLDSDGSRQRAKLILSRK